MNQVIMPIKNPIKLSYSDIDWINEHLERAITLKSGAIAKLAIEDALKYCETYPEIKAALQEVHRCLVNEYYHAAWELLNITLDKVREQKYSIVNVMGSLNLMNLGLNA